MTPEMSDVERVLSWFKAGLILRPDANLPSTVHLARALAHIAGAGVALGAPESEIAKAIGDTEHVVFVLADGLGMNLVESRPVGSILRRHLAMELSAVFPSSTAPALTSLATGTWPSEHGLTGWHVYLPDEQRQITALPFIERFSERSARDAGVSAAVLFPRASMAAGFKRDSQAYFPRRIADSVYSRYTLGGRAAQPYDKLYQGADSVAFRVKAAKQPTYTYLYYPGIDTAEHKHGPSSRQTRVEVERLEQALERLLRNLVGAARVVVSADHGQFDVDESKKLLVRPNDEITELLLTPPSGEGMTPIFHCLPGKADEFARRFRARFGTQFALLTADEVESMRMLGPGVLSKQTRARLGDYMGLSSQGEVLVYEPDKEVVAMRGFHGGLSSAEVRIPLIVA